MSTRPKKKTLALCLPSFSESSYKYVVFFLGGVLVDREIEKTYRKSGLSLCCFLILNKIVVYH